VAITRLSGHSERLEPPLSELSPERDLGPADIALIEEIRPKLDSAYRTLAVEDLVADAALVTARKPG
jgi:hypothetical protein